MKNKLVRFLISLKRKLRELSRNYAPQLEQQAQANSWPPATTGATIGVKLEGITTVRWGTEGLLQSPKPSSGFYLVSRFAQSPKQEVSYLENGNGIQTTRVRLTHGHQWDVTVRDDTNMTPPKAGDTIVVTDAGGIVPCASPAVGNVFTCSVVDPSYDSAPKQPGERVMRVEALLLIKGTNGVLVAGTAV